MPLTPGAKLGDYEIRRPLGAGGMGEVYLAHDTRLGRSVAIKMLSGEVSTDHPRVKRFEQEARAASALSHPNVCVVHALGETSEGQPFIAMEYIEGQTLRHLLQTQPPSLKTALDIAIQIASGAGAAHAIGIVHRDLKPENVIVRQDGLVKVLDFGLAKLGTGSAAVDGATRTLVNTDAGVVMGTYTYMAPEQARGQEVDARADIWALGVILYETVSGRVPFTGHTPSDVMVAILDREPAPLDKLNPAIPHELQRIVAKALRKDRAQRYQTIADLRLDLEALKGELQAASPDAAPGAAVTPPPVPTPQPVRRESSAEYILTGLARHKLSAAVALLAIAALATGAILRGCHGVVESPRTSAGRVQPNLTRLTFGEGLQTNPTFSPDGRYIAYASDRAGNFDIWVQPVAGGDPVQITKGPEADTQPAWSPDGASIVFRSEKDGGGLFIVPQLGGPVRRLTAFGERPVWSSNGSEVFFNSGLVGANLGYLSFYSVAADGGTPEELASRVLRHGKWKWVAPHPDGRLSAIGWHETQGFGFYTFSRSGDRLIKSNTSSAQELVNQNEFDRCRFVWNRAGSWLFIEAKVRVENIWRVEVDPETLNWRGAERLTTGGASDNEAVLSSDGSHLAYVQRNTSRRLWWFPFEAATGALKQEGRPFTDASLEANGGDLSADGSAAVYVLVRPGSEQFEVWTHQFETGTSQLIAPSASFPAWAPDGRSVVYVKFRAPGAGQALALRQPDGNERQLSQWDMRLALLPGNGQPGTRSVVVSAYSGDIAPLWLWGLDTLSEKPQRVVIDRPRTNIWQPRVSPNGRWLAFTAESVGASVPLSVQIARLGDGPITEWRDAVPSLPKTDKPRWSPDGHILYFLVNQGGFWNLGGVHFDPERGVAVGEPFEVTHFDSPSLAISPLMDRAEIGIATNRALLPMESSTGSIWMLDNVDK
jgi:eukaryotic-like serine/threonine-protein kinase